MGDSESNLLDHARCRSGHLTPVQRSTPQSIEEYRRSLETGTEPLYVGCMTCNRVYKALELVSLRARFALHPFQPQAQLILFGEPIYCADPAHEWNVEVIGVRNAHTSVENVVDNWAWERDEDGQEPTCPKGHPIPLPLFRS